MVIHLPESILLLFSTESSNVSQFLMEYNSTAGWFPLKSPSVAFIPLLKHANHLYINVELYYLLFSSLFYHLKLFSVCFMKKTPKFVIFCNAKTQFDVMVSPYNPRNKGP